jgi:hypothetical protein
MFLAEGEGVEPSRRNARPGFQDQLRAAAHHLPYEKRSLVFEFDVLGTMIQATQDAKARSKYKDPVFGACGRTRTYEVRTDARFTVECFCCSATHAK